ncbi:PIG-L family deacetylase [Williamsia sp.]|uniref:PIG-L family deacetylase n=1 Tax=Williamsia sp. TaxID=1872085 RepID=UPI002F940A4F
MSVLVCFHAHPDDEVFGTGGTMRQASDAGHRVVLVTATDGAAGEFPDGILAAGETLTARRRDELAKAAEALGVHRVVMLGFSDSGMAGTPENDNPKAFANLSVEIGARALADVLIEEQADVVTIYDSYGGYGHPDHIQVHHVGMRAAEIAGTRHVYESVMNRDHFRELVKANAQWDEEDAPNMEKLGVPAEEISTEIEVGEVIETKRAAMFAHATQVGDFGPFLEMPVDMLRVAFGREWFRRIDGTIPRPMETALPL